jgi:hypothetical protein
VDDGGSHPGFKPSTSICQTLKFQHLAAQWGLNGDSLNSERLTSDDHSRSLGSERAV